MSSLLTRDGRDTLTEAAPSDLRILVVEDNEDSALSQALLLRLMGHQVFIALDGLAALKIAKLQDLDVVLLDLGLPGMDGWTTARLLQEQALVKRPFIIAVSGFGRPEDIRRSSEVGIDLHLLKPVDPKQLDSVLQRFKRVVR